MQHRHLRRQAVVGLAQHHAVRAIEHLVGHRDTLDAWAGRKGPDGIVEYWGQKNQTSIDGLPALAE